MLSRVADSLYWLGRYGERVETNAHIMNMQMDQMLEQGSTERHYKQQWSEVLDICGYMEDYETRINSYQLEHILRYLLTDTKNFNSINALLESIRTNAKNTRDCIPNELFEEWNSLYLTTKNAPLEDYNVLSTTNYLQQVRKTSLTAAGIIDSLMTRDESFLFLKIGKWLERSEKTALITIKMMEMENDASRHFAATTCLQLTNSFEEYTRRTRNRESDSILNFLVGDTKCSRSVAYGLRKIKRTLLDIEAEKVHSYAVQLFEALDELEELVKLDAGRMTLEERKEWIRLIHERCIQFGPIFSKTYYLTPPILVK
ncbi:MAG: alpha-E domain-containing protein [Solibacillus sp.]